MTKVEQEVCWQCRKPFIGDLQKHQLGAGVFHADCLVTYKKERPGQFPAIQLKENHNTHWYDVLEHLAKFSDLIMVIGFLIAVFGIFLKFGIGWATILFGLGLLMLNYLLYLMARSPKP